MEIVRELLGDDEFRAGFLSDRIALEHSVMRDGAVEARERAVRARLPAHPGSNAADPPPGPYSRGDAGWMPEALAVAPSGGRVGSSRLVHSSTLLASGSDSPVRRSAASWYSACPAT